MQRVREHCRISDDGDKGVEIAWTTNKMSDYEWDSEEANLLDKVPNWVQTYLFLHYKFLKDGWMEYNDSSES